MPPRPGNRFKKSLLYITATLFLVTNLAGALTTWFIYKAAYADTLKGLEEIARSRALQAAALFDANRMNLDLTQPAVRKLLEVQTSPSPYLGARGCLIYLQTTASGLAQLRLQTGRPAFFEVSATTLHRLPGYKPGKNSGWFASDDDADRSTLNGFHYHEPLQLKVIAQIDFSEYLGRYRNAILISLGLAFLLIIAGGLFFLRIGRPVFRSLQDSQERHRGIIEASVSPIITIDARGIIESVNQATLKLFGYSEEALIGHTVNKLMPHPFREEHDEYIQSYLRTGIARIIGIGREVTAVTRAGRTFPVFLSVSRMKIGERLVFTGILQDITALKQAENSIRELSGKLIQVEENERSRISREIHDNLGTSLFLLKMQIQSCFAELKKGNFEFYPDKEREIIGTLNEIVQSARSMSHDLSPLGIEEMGLSASLNRLLDSLEKNTTLKIIRDFRLIDDIPPGDSVNINVYRIIQEALNNISKHSNATEVYIGCLRKNNFPVVVIRDNGRGMPEKPEKSGIGLATMRERARLAGAVIRFLNTETTKGLEVQIEFKTQV